MAVFHRTPFTMLTGLTETPTLPSRSAGFVGSLDADRRARFEESAMERLELVVLGHAKPEISCGRVRTRR